jgi:hypothetical protein
MRVVNQESDAIDYRLHIIGIRVWKDTTQLIAKYGEEWTTIGFARELPVHIPVTASELKAAGNDTLRLTAYQYDAECPGTDLREVLAQEEAREAAAELKMTAGEGAVA